MNKLISYLKRKFDRKIFSKFLKKIDRLSLTSLDEKRRNNIFRFHRNDYKFEKDKFVFIHTPKTAGSSATIFLDSMLGNKLYKWEKWSQHHPISLICPPKDGYKYITFIREPVSRVFSFYNTSLTTKHAVRHSIAKRGLADMLINCWEVRNLYCQYFSGFVRDTVNEEIFQIANENLKNFYFVGDFANFENDLHKLSEKLNINKDKIPHIAMYSRQNYKSLDEDSLNLIKNYNQFDLRLYDEFIKNKQFN